jgi:NarL family two-component system response regulator LiaR
MDKASIPIFLVEDNPADVALIQKLTKKAGILNPFYVARDGQEAIDFLHRRFVEPGVVILDIHLPRVNGIEVLKETKRVDPDAVVIMLTARASLDTAIESLRHEGAFDYLEKSKDNPKELVEAIRLAIEKRMLQIETHWAIQDEGRSRVIDMMKVQEAFGLSTREVDVIKCVCRGDANKEIAERLFISELTVKGHLKNIYQKMSVHNRATLVSKVLAGAVVQGDAPKSPVG